MAIGDQVFFYHSRCKDPGIMGIAVVSKPAYPDATQFNPDCKYFDPKAAINNPRWFNVEVTLVKEALNKSFISVLSVKLSVEQSL